MRPNGERGPNRDLFGAPEEKSYPGENGVKLPYWERDGKIIRAALSDKLIVDSHTPKGRPHIRVRARVGQARKERQNAKTSFLSHAALVRRAFEINDSIYSKVKE